MPKRLVMCCDGTWNTPDALGHGNRAPTNVTKVALAVAAMDARGARQLVYYHKGVGTNRWDRLRGGAFGLGLSRNIRDAYRFIAENFDPGDELFFFGFSRGAFTARSTVGFVRNAGVLRRQHLDRIDEAYALYRSRSSRTHPRSIEAQLFRRSYSHETRIRFIGVWDTVGALGIPLSGLRLINVFNRRWQFHDTDLSTYVDHAFQALAIDEERGPFEPTVWKQQANAGGQRLQQVWFAGVHGDVGGGYRDPALSEIPLLWMVDRARSCGLAFEPDAFAPPAPSPGADPMLRHTGHEVAPDALGTIHQSRTGFYRWLKPYRREPGVIDGAHEFAASSADDRVRKLPEYAPPGLIRYLSSNGRIMKV
jgi:uncharacterized protein (DUF2235 family)